MLNLRCFAYIVTGDTFADLCKMLLTELQLAPTDGWWEVRTMPSVSVMLHITVAAAMLWVVLLTLPICLVCLQLSLVTPDGNAFVADLNEMAHT